MAHMRQGSVLNMSKISRNSSRDNSDNNSIHSLPSPEKNHDFKEE